MRINTNRYCISQGIWQRMVMKTYVWFGSPPHPPAPPPPPRRSWSMFMAFLFNQGRRTNGMEGPQYVSTLSPDAPVMVEGGWTQPSIGEVRKSLTVHQLENHLQEVKGQQRQQASHSTRPVVDGSKKLYSQPNMVNSCWCFWGSIGRLSFLFVSLYNKCIARMIDVYH